jgi:hypothetical protein
MPHDSRPYGFRDGLDRLRTEEDIAPAIQERLAYPKFKLTRTEIRGIIEQELLPYVSPVGKFDDAFHENAGQVKKNRNA